MRAPPRLWPSLLLLAASLIISAALAELLVLLVAGEQPKFPRRVVAAPWGLRYNEPGARYRHKSADMTTYFRINRQGMRSDRDFSYEKISGRKRIVSLGDSFTIGYEVDVKKCFSSVLEDQLRQAGVDAEVLNTGVPGYSSAEEFLYLQRELMKYAPDVVLISFYGNDVEDNLRTNLFRVEGGHLVAQNPDYIPAGSIGNYLNTSMILNLLSERSNAFALAKERITFAFKRAIVDENVERIHARAEATPEAPQPEDDPGVQLTVAIFEGLYAFLRAQRIPLIIQSIPNMGEPVEPGATHGPRKLVEMFPVERFDCRRPGLYFVSAKEFLEPSGATQLLYWTRSHGHWTPFSHAASGRRLAELILDEKLLQ